METTELQTVLGFFKALAAESRLKMVGLLATRECSVDELAALLGLSAPTVSHHLARLKELDLGGSSWARATPRPPSTPSSNATIPTPPRGAGRSSTSA